MLHLGVTAATFGLIFVGELPDKTAIASLVLGTRFPWRWAYAGVAAAFLVHVVIAVVAGSLLTLLPHRAVEVVVAALFLVGAVLIWREGRADPAEAESDARAAVADDPGAAGFWKVASTGFAVVVVAEWGDLTQILTANLTAKYHAPISVAVGSVLALWAVALLAMLGGRTLLRFLPMRWIARAAAVVMAGLAVYSALKAA